MSTRPVPTEEYQLRLNIIFSCGGSTSDATHAYKRITGRKISEDTLRKSKRAALGMGLKPTEIEIPPSHVVKGTSTLLDAETGEPKLQWVKTDVDRDKQEEQFRNICEALTSNLPKASPPQKPKGTEDDLLALYPVGDHHKGMLSWEPETGEDYDLKIAETLLVNAFDYLLRATPKCRQAVVAILGDFTHHDGYEPVTPTNKNPLDTDSRFPRIIRVAIRSIRYLIENALKRHEVVHVIVIPGNHDPATSIFLMEALANIYENEPRVAVDTSPSWFHYHVFGKCLFGFYHGHRVKLDKLPMIMATDRPDSWGTTKYRYWLTGHIHKDTVQDLVGCRVESLRVLAAQDAWSVSEGYRSMREMKAMVYHRNHGEVSRHTVNPGMLE